MTWRLAKSLVKLRDEINAAFPTRSKISDGSIGDVSHSARTSDHNPNNAGVVCAIDVTNDEKVLSGQTLADALYRSKDKRIKYVIWNKRISIQPFGSGWKPYNGANAHQHHVHISVSKDAKLYDDASAWNLKFGETPTESPTTAPDPFRLLKKGDTGEQVSAMQKQLVILGYLRDTDGAFGAFTEKAVKAFQEDYNLTADGVFGQRTAAKLNEVYAAKKVK